MRLESKGIIINFIKTINDAYVISILTESNGIFKGYYKNNSNKKIVIGALVYMKWYSRLIENLGYITIDTEKSIPPHILTNYSRMCLLNSILNIINYAIPVQCKNIKIYNELYIFIFEKDPKGYLNWYTYHITMEMYLLKILGFGFSLDKCYVNPTTKNVMFISPKTGNAVCEEIGKPFENKLFIIPKLLKDLYHNNIIDYKMTKQELEKCYQLLFFFIKKNIFHDNIKKIYHKRINIIKYIQLD